MVLGVCRARSPPSPHSPFVLPSLRLFAHTKIPLVPELLHCGRADAHPLQPSPQPIAHAVAAPRWVLARGSPGRAPPPPPGCSSGDSSQSGADLQPLNPVRLEAPIVFIEPGPTHATTATRLRNIPERLGQLQQTLPALHQLLLRRHHRLLRERVPEQDNACSTVTEGAWEYRRALRRTRGMRPMVAG